MSRGAAVRGDDSAGRVGGSVVEFVGGRRLTARRYRRVVQQQVALELPASPPVLFALVADFGRLEEWDPGVLSSRWRSRGPAVGETCDVVFRFMGTRAAVTYRLDAYEPPIRARYVGQARYMTSTDSIELSPVPGGTRLRLEASMELRGPLLLIRPLLPVVFGVAERRALASLRRAFHSDT